MIYLLIVSIVWAFSFGLIKGNLTGLDSNFVSFVRLSLSFLVFLPFMGIRNLSIKKGIQLGITGMLQYGLMYIAYIYSYQFLKAYEVALFTIFTPIYVTVIDSIIEKKIEKLFYATSILAVIGTGVIVYNDISRSGLLLGFMIVQISNICFALGQILYKKIMEDVKDCNNLQVFGLLYFGAVIITGIFSAFTVNYNELTLSSTQISTLLYLGIIASGVCFFLWNVGARKTNTGALAIFNNLKVPLGIAFSLLFFGEGANAITLSIGGVIIVGAIFLNEYGLKRKEI